MSTTTTKPRRHYAVGTHHFHRIVEPDEGKRYTYRIHRYACCVCGVEIQNFTVGGSAARCRGGFAPCGEWHNMDAGGIAAEGGGFPIKRPSGRFKSVDREGCVTDWPDGTPPVVKEFNR